jgi:hypothetical protein
MKEPPPRYDPPLGARIWLFAAILVAFAVIGTIIDSIN